MSDIVAWYSALYQLVRYFLFLVHSANVLYLELLTGIIIIMKIVHKVHD